MPKRKSSAPWFEYVGLTGLHSADRAKTLHLLPCNVQALTILQSRELLSHLHDLFCKLLQEGIVYYDAEDREFEQWLAAGCPANCITACDCLETCIENVQRLFYTLFRERTTAIHDLCRSLKAACLTKKQRTPPLMVLRPMWPVLDRLDAEVDAMLDWSEARGIPPGQVTVADYLVKTVEISHVPQYVTLDQCAAMVNRSKRTLESQKKNADFPSPTVKGGGGKPDEWDWQSIRPWLERTYNKLLPVKFPTSRRI